MIFFYFGGRSHPRPQPLNQKGSGVEKNRFFQKNLGYNQTKKTSVITEISVITSDYQPLPLNDPPGDQVKILVGKIHPRENDLPKNDNIF